MNSINPLTTDAASLTKTINSLSGNLSEADKSGFSDVFNDIYELAESTEKQNEGSALSLLTGDVNDISNVLIDSEKAEIALSLTIQIRNKLLDSYNEIMNMQV
jgi:flagellar hook-basal body complex protein FliE